MESGEREFIVEGELRGWRQGCGGLLGISGVGFVGVESGGDGDTFL